MTKILLDDLDTAYLLGITLSKANIKPRVGVFSVRSIDHGVCYRVKIAAKMLLSMDVEIEPVDNSYVVEIHHKELCDWMLEKTEGGRVVPAFVHNQTEEWLQEFVAGVLDGTGWITTKKRDRDLKSGIKSLSTRWSAGITSENNELVGGLSILFNRMGIKHSYKDGRVSGGGKSTIRFKIDSLASSRVYFYSKRKQGRLDELRVLLQVRSETR